MSRSFLEYTKLFTSNKKKLNLNPYIFLIIIPHCIYAISSEKKENIIISSKYKYVNNGFTSFMIIDDKGNHFDVNNSFWYWKWDSIEDWHKLKIGDNIYAQYYGFRIPFLSCFPNIVNTNYITKKISNSENQTHLISIDPVLTTNNDVCKKNIISAALATFK
jgi:hypothetical protein